jgi:hypothetical protein
LAYNDIKEKIMKRIVFIAILVFISVFLFLACDIESFGLEKGFNFDEKTFNSKWSSWQNNNIQNYSFTMTGQFPHWNSPRAILMYDYEVNIIVKNGIMDSFEYIGINIPYEDDLIMKPAFTSITDMFQKIYDNARIERDWWKNNSAKGIISTTFVLEYDPVLNYIKYFVPVSNWESGWIVDTTAHTVTISNFTILDSEDYGKKCKNCNNKGKGCDNKDDNGENDNNEYDNGEDGNDDNNKGDNGENSENNNNEDNNDEDGNDDDNEDDNEGNSKKDENEDDKGEDNDNQ